jgi:aromatic ring-opening dioxygenase catalytic subunit (LigB family)
MRSVIKPGLSRRDVLVGAAVSGAALAAGAASLGVGGAVGAQSSRTTDGATPSGRMPVVFLPHGGGPWPFVDLGRFVQPGEVDSLASYLRSVSGLPRPRAMLVVSAHWEEDVPTVMTSAAPPILYDYYGFPPASYDITWPAPGSPALAARVQELLGAAGIASATDASRGFDHGTFIPLKLTFPDADVPTIQLSLERRLDPAQHLAIGRSLAPLRDEGVLIVGSGMSYHDMRGFGGAGQAVSETFDAWLRETATATPERRDSALASWASAPAARQAHPREEHLLPLMVIAGAAGDDVAEVAWSGTFGGARISAFHFGA